MAKRYETKKYQVKQRRFLRPAVYREEVVSEPKGSFLGTIFKFALIGFIVLVVIAALAGA